MWCNAWICINMKSEQQQFKPILLNAQQHFKTLLKENIKYMLKNRQNIAYKLMQYKYEKVKYMLKQMQHFKTI